jgi:hypothetical protein
MSERDPLEHFVEETWVSRALFEARDFGDVIVDPCAGFGNIVASARAAGLRAYGSDIVARAPGIAGGRDFLSGDWRAPKRAGAEFAIVTNPPFGGRKPLIRDIARLALERAPKVAILIPTRRIGPAGDWLEDLPLVEELHVRVRTSLWPGAEYRRRVEAGEKLKAGKDPVTWLIFQRRVRRRQPRVGWLRRAEA